MSGDVWEADGARHEWVFDGVKMHIRMMDERSRVDLNAASAELLEGLMRSAGVEEDLIPAVRDAIIDWRDSDNVRLLDGAEDDDYSSLDMGYGAKDGDFDSVAELQLVMGVTPEVFNLLAPHLTVYSGNARVSPVAADRVVLGAFPDSTEESVEAYIAERNALLENALPLTTLPPIGSGNTIAGRANIVRIVCEVHAAEREVPFLWGAVVDTASTGVSGPEVLAWLTRIAPDQVVKEASFDE
jgi:general secretion pathway protein K